MILQPLVENAVRHGVARKSGPGRVEIIARCVEQRVTIEVRDDGPGFPAGWDLASVRGVGLANTRDRLRQMYGDAHRLDVCNAPDGGAMVLIELPHSRTARPSLSATGSPGREE